MRAQVSKQTNISAQVLFSEGPVAIWEVVGLILAYKITLVTLGVIGPAPLGTEIFLAYRNNLFSGPPEQF